jgi:DNA gyrase/topoisomerase IV subunit A
LARWVVIETHGLCGGVFRDQAAALRYAEEECQAYQADFEISGEPVSLKFP